MSISIYYCSTFLGSAQIILFSSLSNFSRKNKLNVKNLKNSIKVAIFEPTTNSTK
jgi:hypothetical protein